MYWCQPHVDVVVLWRYDAIEEEPVPIFNPLNALFGAFGRDLGIDLGTANTLVHVRGRVLFR